MILKRSIDRKKVNISLLNLFVMISVLIPSDIYNIKKILFFFLCIYNFRFILNFISQKKNNFYLFFAVIFPTVLLIYSMILTTDIYTSFVRSFAAYIFVLVIIVKSFEIDFEKILIGSLKLIAASTLIIVFIDLIGLVNINTNVFLRTIFYDYEVGLLGKSIEYPFYYKVFIKTSPLLVILIFKYFEKREIVALLVVLLSLVLSGTRANVIFPILILVLYYFSSAKNKILKINIAVFSILVFSLFFPHITSVSIDTFITKGANSDNVRLGHLEGIYELVNEEPWVLITGTGMGSEFYSYGKNEYVSSIEWSYIDLWRQMGFPVFALFLFFLLSPFLIKSTSQKYKKYAYATYLIIAATNPLLFSSTSYLMFIYIFYDLKVKKQGDFSSGNS